MTGNEETELSCGQSHQYLTKELAIYPAISEEPLKIFEQGSSMSRFQVFFPSPFLISMIMCLL